MYMGMPGFSIYDSARWQGLPAPGGESDPLKPSSSQSFAGLGEPNFKPNDTRLHNFMGNVDFGQIGAPLPPVQASALTVNPESVAKAGGSVEKITPWYDSPESQQAADLLKQGSQSKSLSSVGASAGGLIGLAAGGPGGAKIGGSIGATAGGIADFVMAQEELESQRDKAYQAEVQAKKLQAIQMKAYNKNQQAQDLREKWAQDDRAAMKSLEKQKTAAAMAQSLLAIFAKRRGNMGFSQDGTNAFLGAIK